MSTFLLMCRDGKLQFTRVTFTEPGYFTLVFVSFVNAGI